MQKLPYHGSVAAVSGRMDTDIERKVAQQKQKLKSFHHRCLRSILGIINSQQWEQCITSQEIRQRWGGTATVTEKEVACCSEWLGHLA